MTGAYIAAFFVAFAAVASAYQANSLRMMATPFDGLFKSATKSAPSKTKTIAITGANGVVGTALRKQLASKDINIISISSSMKSSQLPNEEVVNWDVKSQSIDASQLEGVDAIVHLAGEGVASGEGPLAPLGRWSDSKKGKILDSRVEGTSLIVNTIKQLKKKPKVFISASGVGYYGYNTPDTVFDESDKIGDGFLAKVCEEWESEALSAEKAGVRTVCLRLGVVLSKKGGVLGKLGPIFSLGAGGNIGSGDQPFSWVTINDVVRAIEFATEKNSLKGVVNVCSPNPTDNAGFTKALGGALGRPTIFPVPTPVAKVVFGEMGEEMLLGGQKVLPSKLTKAGFAFEDADIDDAVKSVIKQG